MLELPYETFGGVMKHKISSLITLLGLMASPTFAQTPPRANPSGKAFLPGERVQTAQTTTVWSKPPMAGGLAGQQAPRSFGRIMEGPLRSVEAQWWKVDFDFGSDGWVAQRDLRKSGGGLPPLPPPPSGSITSAPTASFVNLSLANGMVIQDPKTVLCGSVVHDLYPPSQISVTLNGQSIPVDANGNFKAPINWMPGMNHLTLQASTPNPRQQVNQISAFLDASMIYGSDTNRAMALRTLTGGMLKTSSGSLLPLNTGGYENANDAHIFPDAQLFLAGDVRANENTELTSLHTLFVREHNLLATAIAAANRGLNDEQIYQRARRLVIAEIQAITFQEFLPALMGANSVRPYPGYRPEVNPGLATEFSTAAFRVGHTLINDDIQFLNNNAEAIRDGLALAFAFFNPAPLKEVGPDPLLKYLATDNTQEVDTQLVEGLRNFLFGPPGAGGLDLASLNIQRGRDHGLADYNTVRVAYGLPKVTDVSQITSDPGLQNKLRSLYGSPDSMDLWVAGLAENHLPGSSLGPTFQKIISHQFERTRDGDFQWYERVFSGKQLAALRATRLSDLIRRNTSLTKIQSNVFLFDDVTTLPGLIPQTAFLPPDLVAGPGALGPIPSLDGTGNNPFHPKWGASGADLLRISPAAYADGVSSPSGENRPNPRLISNTAAVLTTSLPNMRQMSSYVYAWGQFIDHDLGLTQSGDVAFNIPVPKGDPSFDPFSTGTQVIALARSNYDPNTGTSSPTIGTKVVDVAFRPPPQKLAPR